MNDTDWILFDTETTGNQAPIFVVELAAQRMRGWQPQGEPFRKLVNQNSAIPREASRVHGYTREILERDGRPPNEVYREFADYVSNLPLCSYNLEYDLDSVLTPEWKRLGIPAVGKRGFSEVHAFDVQRSCSNRTTHTPACEIREASSAGRNTVSSLGRH